MPIPHTENYNVRILGPVEEQPVNEDDLDGDSYSSEIPKENPTEDDA